MSETFDIRDGVLRPPDFKPTRRMDTHKCRIRNTSTPLRINEKSIKVNHRRKRTGSRVC